MFQLAGPVPCPECDDGQKNGKRCPVCCGSGHVYLTPAERPVSHDEQKRREEWWKKMRLIID